MDHAKSTSIAPRVVEKGAEVVERTEANVDLVEQTTTPSQVTGRPKGKGGRGKDIRLLRQHYGVMKLRQSRLTEFYSNYSVQVAPKKKIHEWVLRCRALRAQARKFTVVDLLKLS